MNNLKKSEVTFLFSLKKIPSLTQHFSRAFNSKVFQRTSLVLRSSSFFGYHCSVVVVVFFYGRIFSSCSLFPPRSASSRSSKDITHNALLCWVDPCVKCLFIGRGARLCSSVALVLRSVPANLFCGSFWNWNKSVRGVKKKEKKRKRPSLAVPVTNLLALSYTQTQTNSCNLPLVAKLTSFFVAQHEIFQFKSGEHVVLIWWCFVAQRSWRSHELIFQTYPLINWGCQMMAFIHIIRLIQNLPFSFDSYSIFIPFFCIIKVIFKKNQSTIVIGRSLKGLECMSCNCTDKIIPGRISLELLLLSKCFIHSSSS